VVFVAFREYVRWLVPGYQWQYTSQHPDPAAALEQIRQICVAMYPQIDTPDVVAVEAAWADTQIGLQAKEPGTDYYIKFEIRG